MNIMMTTERPIRWMGIAVSMGSAVSMEKVGTKINDGQKT
jgi:hypothetical protein